MYPTLKTAHLKAPDGQKTNTSAKVPLSASFHRKAAPDTSSRFPRDRIPQNTALLSASPLFSSCRRSQAEALRYPPPYGMEEADPFVTYS